MQSEASDYSIYRRVVSQLMQGEEQLPSLPTITLDIRRALGDPNISRNTLVRLISRDPALSALLMKHASSALYRHTLPPKTLHEVISMLGMAEVDRITMVHSIKSLFTLYSPGHSLQLLDLVNLALYHAIKEHTPTAELPSLQELAAYQKLMPPQDFIGENGELSLVISHRADIQAIAQTLR